MRDAWRILTPWRGDVMPRNQRWFFFFAFVVCMAALVVQLMGLIGMAVG